MEVQEKQIETELRYGMGAACKASLPESRIRNMTARNVIMAITGSPQSSEPARRAARVVTEAIRSGRNMDVEVYEGANRDDVSGRPVELGDVVIPDRNGKQDVETERLTLQVSEPYVGG
jgi:hypothetical protein